MCNACDCLIYAVFEATVLKCHMFARIMTASRLVKKLTAGDVIGERGFVSSGTLFQQATVLYVPHVLKRLSYMCHV